jgi:hypothetical protein
MRATDGSGELPVASYESFSGTEVLGRMAMERMLAGQSTQRYPVGLKPVGARTEQGRDEHVALGGLAPVRRRDRDRTGRAAGPRPVAERVRTALGTRQVVPRAGLQVVPRGGD